MAEPAGAHEQALARYQRAFTSLDAARIQQAALAADGLLHPPTRYSAPSPNDGEGIAAMPAIRNAAAHGFTDYLPQER